MQSSNQSDPASKSSKSSKQTSTIVTLLKLAITCCLAYIITRWIPTIFKKSKSFDSSNNYQEGLPLSEADLLKSHHDRNLLSGMVHMANSSDIHSSMNNLKKQASLSKNSWLLPQSSKENSNYEDKLGRTSKPPLKSHRSDYEPKCRYHSCFTPCRSSDKFSIYLYPLHSELTYSNEFLQIYHTVLHSEYYEASAEHACMFIPNVDLLVPSEEKVKFLYRLKYFNSGQKFGLNHVLFTEYPELLQGLPIGASIIAGNNFKLTNYRTNFDISIASFNYLHLQNDLKRDLQENFCYVNSVSEMQASLSINCLPVLLNTEIVLPFAPLIDFDSCMLQARRKEDVFVPKKLQIEILEKRGRNLYDYYLSSINRIVLTGIGILRERAFPHVSRSALEWNKVAHNNGMYSNVPYNERSPIFATQVAPDIGFTCVVLAYDRVESLFEVIKRVSQSENLKKIIVVWNNLVKPPPAQNLWPEVGKKIVIIKMDKNRLSNRFFPFAEIQTEAVLAIDDDIVMLTKDELDFGYHVWREFPDRIVGFPSRLHLWAEENPDKLKYESEWKNDVSMVLTGVAFYHNYFNHIYTHQTDERALRFVDDNLNCEDILMNFVVSNATNKAPIKVGPRKKFKCPECDNASSALSVDQSHMVERSSCLNKFHEIFGRMPLKTVNFRADPVLYRDDIEPKQKRFSDMGDL